MRDVYVVVAFDNTDGIYAIRAYVSKEDAETARDHSPLREDPEVAYICIYPTTLIGSTETKVVLSDGFQDK